MKVLIKTLGCEKNTVDSENAMALLAQTGCEEAKDVRDADVLIVNTCGFIHDAKQQSIETIFDLIREKREGQKLIVTGCLSQRYAKELAAEMPEVDFFLGVNDYAKLPDIVRRAGKERIAANPAPKEYEELPRQFSGGVSASIKIAEGCNNICTYCAIPFIRGLYRSRKPEDILTEAKHLAEQGVKELLVIAQDVTGYGRDFGRSDMLPQLLRDLCAIDGLKWIRLMYCYEDEITPELIRTIREEPKICKYLDIPIQHSSDRILKAMNRKSTEQSIKSTISELRKQIPDIVIRTTLITGFPGETKEDFKALQDFVSEMRFDRLGVFPYSKEEGTAAANMPHQVRSDVKQRRADRIMALQQKISLENNQKYIGRNMEVLVEEVFEDGSYSGRTCYDAPEIDDGVLFTGPAGLQPGSFVTITITDAFDYDLSGEYYEPAK
ncbi:MAG: 30S ribosomal protein S12 methylthiotransferase RimO [Firmicutes bacterium]|nr:30S ribosomal protein S12 methylthiotransferase RimO [Bacillota bacterium]MBR0050629.1 30S ribosomal protein S12 methylthiotransferase RimO [Bacillota bacterium]